MSSEPDSLSRDDSQLNEIIAQYLQAVEAGASPDPEQLLRQHPGYAEELRQFLADKRQVDAIAGAVNEDSGAPKDPRLNPLDVPTLPPENTAVDAPPSAPSAAAKAAPKPGAVLRYFGDYELLAEIARGGMGVVYKARQVKLNRVVAIKMILAGQLASQEDVQRFYTEAEAAAGLDHPGIVPIYEVGEHEGQHYFSMGFVDGESLSGNIAERPLAPRDAANLLHKIAQAVQYAHDQGVIHRDLKPANVLLDRYGEPKITDFGLAKQIETESGMTASGQILGTPSYMPPEQAAGRLNAVCETADVYSLGAILYAVLTGRPPFQADNPLDTLMQVLEREPISPRQLNPNIPRDLETIGLKCLDKDRRRRYQSAQQLAEELLRFIEGRPIVARPIMPIARAWRWCKRKPVVASLTLLAVFLLLGGTTISSVFAVLATRERDRAEQNAVLATKARDEANDARDEAKRQTLETRRRAYISDINLIQQSLSMSKLGQARRLLYAQVPEHGQEEERGWEWRYLWQQCRSQAEYQLAQEANTIATLCIAHDGTWAAWYTAPSDAISVWDLSTRKMIGRLRNSFAALGSSPTEPILAFVPEDEPTQILVWNPTEQREVATLDVGTATRTIAFSGDGRFLVAYTGQEVVRFRVDDWQEVKPRTPTPNWWYWRGGQYAVNHTGDRAAYRTPRDVVLLDLETGTTRWRRTATSEWLAALAFSSDGKILASAASFTEKTIRLWSVEDGVEVGRLHGHRTWVSDLKFVPGENTLISSSADRTIRVWDVTRPEQPVTLLTLRGHPLEVTRVALHPASGTLISGDNDGGVLVWNLNRVKTRDSRRLLPYLVSQWEFGSDGRSLITLDPTGRVEQWQEPQFDNGELLFEVGAEAMLPSSGWRSPRTSTLFSPDGRLLAALTSNDKVVVWDVDQRKVCRELPVGKIKARLLLFMDDGERLLIGDPDSSAIHLWNLQTGEEEEIPTLRHFDKGSWALSADQRWVLGLGQHGDGQLLDRQQGHVRRLTLETRNSSSGAFSADHSLFAVAARSGYVKLWDADSFTEVGQLKRFLIGAHSLTFSPDGTRLAAGSGDLEAVKLWDVRSQRELLNLEGQGSLFYRIRFSASGDLLATSPEKGPVHIWRAPSWEEIEAAEPEAGRLAENRSEDGS